VENDGQAVLNALEDRGNKTIPEVFLGIEGPFAFIYYDTLSKQIWFGRDPLGRRSLMKLENVSRGLFVSHPPIYLLAIY
jgi:asparagine synthetase B (glutamine-hydrolysing)